MSDLERRYVELRADDTGRTLRGVAVTYGDVAKVAGLDERIQPARSARLAT